MWCVKLLLALHQWSTYIAYYTFDKAYKPGKIQWNLYKADTIGAWKKRLLYGDVRFIEIPYKNGYLAKINLEWVFEINGFHRVKEGHVEWNEKCFYFKNILVKCYYSKTKIKNQQHWYFSWLKSAEIWCYRLLLFALKLQIFQLFSNSR